MKIFRLIFGKRHTGEDWLSGSYDAAGLMPSFQEWCRDTRHPNDTSQIDAYLRAYQARKQKNGVMPMILSHGGELCERITTFLSAHDRFGLEYQGAVELARFAGKHITRLTVRSGHRVELTDCEVISLSLGGDFVNDARIKNCKIGTLELHTGIKHLVVEDGEIRNFLLHEPTTTPLLFGPVSIKRTVLPHTEKQLQILRALRAQLLRIHNNIPAGFVHAAELRISRREDGCFDKCLGWAYDLGSGYGALTARPLAWLVGFGIANAVMLAAVNATQIAVANSELVGWHAALAGDDPFAQGLRAALLTLGQIFNPLGVFGARNLVIATQPAVALISTILCLLGTASFALFILAVRRRFRLEA